MERLTKRTEQGNAVLELKPNVGEWSIGHHPEIGAYHVMGESISRLAAYEDTGLMPECIDALQQHKHFLSAMLMDIYCGDAVSYARLAEFARAEKDGRLVVMPCKVGDLLYEVDLPSYGVITCKVLYVGYYIGPAGHVQGNAMVSTASVGVKVIDGHGKGSSYDFETADFGKTVFLSREEAEAALKGGAE